MINTLELKGAIASRGLSQRKVAQKLGISENTFYNKMKKGVFGSDEIDAMIRILNLENPMEIFFAGNVAQ